MLLTVAQVELKGKDLQRHVEPQLRLSWYLLDTRQVASVAQLSVALSKHFGLVRFFTGSLFRVTTTRRSRAY